MHRVTDLVNRLFFRTVEFARFRQGILLQETMHGFGGFNEVPVPISVLMFRTKDAAMRVRIKIPDNSPGGFPDGIEIVFFDRSFNYSVTVIFILGSYLIVLQHISPNRPVPEYRWELRVGVIVQSRTMNTEQFNRLEKRLRRKVGSAISDYHMIDDGDRIMVCLSGGKDSYTMLDMLLALQRRAPVRFDLVAVNLDQKQPGYPEHVLPEYLGGLGVEYRIVEADTYSIVLEKLQAGKTMCSLCSRLRRGILYRTAKELGATKIALGHHMDDLVETLFLNMFHGSRMKTMPPKLVSDDRRNVVIRPMVNCREKDIARYARFRDYPIIPCNLCGTQTNLARVRIKNMLSEWEKESPNRVMSIFKSMTRVTRSHMLDTDLHDFSAVSVDHIGDLADLDIAFDPPIFQLETSL